MPIHSSYPGSELYLTKIEDLSHTFSRLIYYGRSKRHSATGSESVWQIWRESTQNNVKTIEYANEGRFDCRWDDRKLYFTPVAFSNQLSAHFDGINDYGVSGTSPSLLFLNNFTISLWIKGASQPNVCLIGENAAGSLRWDIRSGSTAGTSSRLRVRISSTGGTGAAVAKDYLSSVSVLNGNWNHVVISFDSLGTLRVYINGIEDLALTRTADPIFTSLFNEGTGIFVGAGAGIVNLFNGHIDEVSLWKRTLTGSEIAEVYNAGIPTDLGIHSRNLDLITWWRLGDGDELPLSRDNGNSSNNLTLFNGPAYSLDAPGT